MIEGIKEIGDVIISQEPENLLKNLTDEVPIEREGKKQHIVITEFDTVNKKINFDFEEIKEDTSKK
jgi:CRISPR-associated protein TM1802 (cas_TM1802).